MHYQIQTGVGQAGDHTTALRIGMRAGSAGGGDRVFLQASTVVSRIPRKASSFRG